MGSSILSFDLKMMCVTLSLLMRPYCLILMTIHSVHAGAGIEITEIFVPRLRLVGEDAELECRFERSNEVRVYSIKWWRDNDQFYQYIPRNDPPKLPFNVTGIRVDILQSSEVRVILRDVTVDTSGAFTCEVMADESFETVRHSDNMTVVDPPDGTLQGTMGPIIEVTGIGDIGPGPLEYNVGKPIEALCVARRAFPAATLTWTINGREAADGFLTPLQPNQEGRNSFTTRLWLTFTVSEELFDKKGELTLVCNASLGNLWHRHTTVILQNPMMSRARTGLFSSGCTTKLSIYLVTTSLAALLSLNIIGWSPLLFGQLPFQLTAEEGSRQTKDGVRRRKRRRRLHLNSEGLNSFQREPIFDVKQSYDLFCSKSVEILFLNNVFHWLLR